MQLLSVSLQVYIAAVAGQYQFLFLSISRQHHLQSNEFGKLSSQMANMKASLGDNAPVICRHLPASACHSVFRMKIQNLSCALCHKAALFGCLPRICLRRVLMNSCIWQKYLNAAFDTVYRVFLVFLLCFYVVLFL